jgi:hypothetical protein
MKMRRVVSLIAILLFTQHVSARCKKYYIILWSIYKK